MNKDYNNNDCYRSSAYNANKMLKDRYNKNRQVQKDELYVMFIIFVRMTYQMENSRGTCKYCRTKQDKYRGKYPGKGCRYCNPRNFR